MVDLEDLKYSLRKVLMSERFRDALEAHYAMKSALYDDSLEFMAPVEVHTHPRWDMQPNFPYGELNSPISRNLAPDSNVERLGHEIQIFWHVRHDDEIELDTHLIRYLVVTRRYFMENSYLDDLGVGPITMNDDTYSPFVPATVYNARPFVKSGMLTVYIDTFN